jgi:uncharacterized protein
MTTNPRSREETTMNQPTTDQLKGRPWIQTQRGLAWCADAPESYPYDIAEIAHALSHINRFCGHTIAPYSVAQHSVLVALEVARANPEPEEIPLVRAALLHDAAEAFVNDLASPVKQMRELAGYRTLIERVEVAIAEHFGLADHLDHPAIRAADLRLLATEKRDLLGPSAHDTAWQWLPAPVAERIVPMTPQMARGLFIDTWKRWGG